MGDTTIIDFESARKRPRPFDRRRHPTREDAQALSAALKRRQVRNITKSLMQLVGKGEAVKLLRELLADIDNDALQTTSAVEAKQLLAQTGMTEDEFLWANIERDVRKYREAITKAKIQETPNDGE